MRNTKKFFGFDDKPPIHYRPNTSDEAIIQSVFVDRQEYLFPHFEPELVFDIGANIGVTAVILANIYPTARIMAFEPVQENFDLLKLNVESYPKVKPVKCGLGNKNFNMRIFNSDDPTNLGGFSSVKKGELGEEVSIVRTATICQEIGVPDLIKIDCEGAELEILSDVPNLEKVRWVTGELHGVNDYAVLGLLDKHFKLSFLRTFGDSVWHFHAVNKSWTDFGLNSPPK